MLFSSLPSPCQPLSSRMFAGCRLWIKRDDLLHADVSGNKFRKLKYPLLGLRGQQATLVTMGGPWSNHLYVLAHAGALAGWPTIGLVRGDEGVSTATLADCLRLGMRITFVSREQYRTLRRCPDGWRRHVADTVENCIWLPEGGSTPAALHGVAEIIDELPFIPDTILVACGTGATLAGLLAGLQGRGRVIGVAVFKNAGYLRDEVARLLRQAGYPPYDNYTLLTDAHHGGYGKAPPVLRQFCCEFVQETGMPVEPVYTGKLLYAARQLAQSGAFDKYERIVAVHTGGLQGARGFADLGVC